MHPVLILTNYTNCKSSFSVSTELIKLSSSTLILTSVSFSRCLRFEPINISLFFLCLIPYYSHDTILHYKDLCSVLHLQQYFRAVIRGGFRGGRAGRAPPPPKIRKACVIQR
jgi:hypothetical protein